MTTTISGSNGIVFPDDTSMQTGQQAVKAWVSFNGTGTVAIRAGYNVSSVTDYGVGGYTISFTTAMANANYAANVTVQNTVSSDYCSIAVGGITTSALSVSSFSSNGTNADVNAVCVSVFN